MKASQGLSKAVVAARVADSVQYWESACDYFNHASLDASAMRSLFQLYEQSNTEWLDELNRLKRIDYPPRVVTEYLGIKVAGDSALTLAIRSFVHNLRTTFEMLAQFVNAVALADSASVDPDRVNVRSVLTALKTKGGFGDLALALEKIVTTSDYYQYLADLDNTLKHLVAVEPHVQWFILENRLEANLPSFTKEDKKYGRRSYPRKPLLATSQALITFAADILTELDRIVSADCGVAWHPLVEQRCHDLSVYKQYDEQDGKNVLTGQIQFLRVSSPPAKGDVLRVMAVVETDVDGDVRFEFGNCYSKKIVLRDDNRVPIGVAEAVHPISPTDEVEIIEYREYEVVSVGPVSQVDFHKLLNETQYARGRSAGITCGLPSNSFPSGLLTGEPPAILTIPKSQR